eukprot:14929453-Alexandrium_andersonii.AAC.1
MRGSALINWGLYVARGSKCNPQSAQGSPVLQSAAIRNPPFGKHNIAPGIRNLNCADRGLALKWVSGAPE